MKKRWITLGVFFVGVAALGLLVWLKPPQSPDNSHAVSALKAIDVRTIRVLRKGALLAALEKRQSEWYLTAPLSAPAEAAQVSRLLAILEAKATQHYPPSAAGKFGLEAPQAEILINDQRFAFGALNNVTREQYVLTQNQVFALELRFGAAIPADAAALLRRSVLGPDDAPARFDFGAFSVAFDGKKWIATAPAGDVSQDDYNRWVAQWQSGSALRTLTMDNRALQKTVFITLKDGRKITLGIVQTDPELIVRRDDLGLQFVFVGSVGAQMLALPAPPAAAPK
jgi:Domain of unknown function (DUF4340)